MIIKERTDPLTIAFQYCFNNLGSNLTCKYVKKDEEDPTKIYFQIELRFQDTILGTKGIKYMKNLGIIIVQNLKVIKAPKNAEINEIIEQKNKTHDYSWSAL